MPTESDTLKLGWYMREGLGAFVADTAADLPSDVALSALGWVQDPPALYMYTSTGWTPLASLEGAELPVVGNHNLFSTSHPDVDSADTPTDGEILTYDGASSLWKAAPPVPDATETTPGKVELASEAEVQAGTAGVLVANVARLKDELDRRINPLTAAPTWVSATLTSGWTNAAGYQVAQYAKDSLGFVVLRGNVTGGSTGSGATILTLPTGFRPAANERFTTASAAGTATLEIQTDGRVVPYSATGAQASLSGIRLWPA
jgi:hypothetical protein